MRLSKRVGFIGGSVLAAAVAATTFLLSGDSNVIEVAADADLQAAIDAVAPGSTLRLAADGVYTCNCTVNKPLRIESVGERVVGTSYSRTFTVGARIITPNAGPALYIPPRTSDVYVTGVELTHTTFTYDIVKIGNWGAEQDTVEEAPRNITMHRVWVRGQQNQDVQRGIAGNGANVTVTFSRIDEIHGYRMETQGFAAWNGPGPFNISDNWIAAASENIMFGGSDSSICITRGADGKCTQGMVATGLTIRRNHLYKPLSWYTQHPTYAGKHWSVKNIFELKAARNFIVDGNILENCWGDAQIGFAVLLTVRNQDGANPWNVVENGQFTNNDIRNVAGGFQIIGKDYPNASLQGTNIRIANNRVTMAQGGALGPNGRLLQMERTVNLTFENNEANPDHTVVVFSGEEQQPGLVYHRNVVTIGEYGVTPASLSPKDALTRFAPGHDFSGNVLVASTDLSRFYPAGNSFVTSWPNPVPVGVGVDPVAFKAAQQGGEAQEPSPSPKPSADVSPSPVPSVSVAPSPSPLPPPATPGTSANNTRTPPASVVVDGEGALWTLSGTRMLRNGLETGGYGYELLWCNGRMYGKGEDLKYWAWTNPGWAQFGADPCAVATPTPTATATPQPTATATPAPTATPTPVRSPSPAPTVRKCRSNERPVGCVCPNGVRRNGKCW